MLLNKLSSNILFTFACLLGPICLWAQPVNNLVNDVVMPSPNATAFGKYVDIPVSYHTGVPNISIPIHTIQEGPLTVPVGLSYHASGVKVGELASWVGLGWNLEAGGVVTRTVMNVPDEKNSKQGYYANGISLSGVPFSQANLGLMLNGELDTEPDLYTFSMPGLGGKFYSNGSQGFTLTNKQDITIKATHSASGEEFEGFVITAPNGTRYIFGKDPNDLSGSEVICEKIRFNNSIPVRNTWYLIKIETHDRKFSINYTYTTENYSYRSLASSRLVYSHCDGATAFPGTAIIGSSTGWSYAYPGRISGNFEQAHPYMRTDVEGKRLTQISAGSGTAKVTFNSTTDRQDVDPNPNNFNNLAKELDEIQVEFGTPTYRCKKFVFNQSYWTGNFYPLGQSEIKRLRLNGVQEFSCTTGEPAITIPAHTFEYENSAGSADFLPNRLSKAVDHWGFYNAAEGTNEDAPVNVPNIDVTYNGSTTPYESPNNVNRNTNPVAMKNGTLKAITYPTGGKTEFTFEANTVPDLETELVAFNKSTLNGGFYIQNCQFPYNPGPTECCTNNTNSANFTLTENEISTGKVELKVTYLNRNDGAYCSDQTPSAFITLNVYNLTDNTFMGSKQINATAYNANATATVLVNLNSLALNSAFVANTKTYKFEIVVTQGWGKASFYTSYSTEIATPVGGLRIAQIRTQKSATQAPDDIIRTYEYALSNGQTSGKLVRKPKYSQVQAGSATGGGAYWDYQFIALFSDSEVPLASAEGYHLRYERVTEHFNGNGKKVYNFFIEEEPFNGLYNNLYPVPPIPSKALDGKLKQEETFSANSPTQAQAKTVFTSDVYYKNSTTKMVKLFRLGVNCLGGSSPYVGTEYIIRTGTYLPYLVESTLDGVSTSTSYTYDPTNRFLAPIAITTTNSDGKAYTTEYTYPNQVIGNATVTEMVNRNMIASPVQVVKKHAGQVIDGSRSNYSFFGLNGDYLTPTNSNGGNPIYPSTFERYEVTYDENGMLQAGAWDLQSSILAYTPSGLPREVRTNNWLDSELYTWNAAGNILSQQFKDFTTSYSYYTGTQLLQTVTDVDGQQTTYTYDALARPSTVNARGGNIKSTVTYGYAGQGSPVNTHNYRHFKTEYTETSGIKTQEARTYFDGLGRSIQSVALAHNPTDNKDVINALEYDQYGRVSKTYTPYVSTATTPGAYVAVPGGQKFNQISYEASPFNRPLSVVAPETWHTATFSYGSNSAADQVALDGALSTYYAAGLLYKRTMTDADGNQTIGFMDKLGRSLLSRSADPTGTQKADTYSLYDNKGRIIHTLPPQTTITTSNLIYSYRYDVADNLTDLKQPDADWVKIWYNNKDLPALYQDGNMRVGTQKFLATNYDAYGREINTGFVGSIPPDLGSIGFASPEDVMSELIYGTNTETNPIRKVSLLQARFKTLTFDGNNDPVLGTNFFYDPYGRVSYTISNDGWLTSTYDERMDYTYDMRDNVLSQIYSQNVNSAPKTFKHTWEYDTWDRMINYFLNPTTSTDNGQHIARYDYDLRGRLTQRNLGKYGTSSNWLQSLDYTYNELDWLTAINPQGSSGLGVTQNMNEPLGIPTPGFNPASADPDNNDLFFLELKYHDPYANLDVPAISRKSGDISQVWWRARGRNREGYGLTYDYLGRMTKAQHVRLADGSSPTTPGAKIINNYSEQLEYADQRGNIARILRYGMNYTSSTQAGSGVIDDLQFITEPGRNRIQRINEQATDLVFKLKGFRPKTEANGSTSTGGIDYSYDANGNQTSDPHKGILTIQYNYLNLPSLITYTDGRKIEQRYDAAGNLIFRWMTGDVATPANNYFQTYVYGTEYRGNTIESVVHQEGRLFRSGGSNSSPVWRYEYSISDHLGNTRLTFADKTPDGIIKVEDGEVLEEAHYYPFGLAMEGPWMNDAAALDNRYKFNGIERVQDFGLNVDMAMYRAYDPAIGRWWQIDPMAAIAPEQTPYRFGFNSPMNFSDPFGLFETRKEAREYKEENDVEGKVKKQKDGTFAVVNKKSGGFVTKDQQYGITFGITGKGSQKSSISDKFWGVMERLDEKITWEDDGSGEKVAKLVAEFNPIISGAHAYSGFTKGENYFGEKINATESSLYAIGAIPSLKAATGLKLLGAGATISGILRVPKKWLGYKVGLGGSKSTLLSSAVAEKLGLKGTIKPKWTPYGEAKTLETYLGRTAVIWGPGMIGTGFLIEYFQNKNKQGNGTDGTRK